MVLDEGRWLVMVIYGGRLLMMEMDRDEWLVIVMDGEGLLEVDSW